MKLYCIPTNQGTGNSETCLCEKCMTLDNATAVRLNALHIDDIDHTAAFEDCSGNDAVECYVCGFNIVEQ